MYVDNHETCAGCGGQTQFDIDLNDNGRAVVNPQGDTIKCGSCSEFVCGECKSPEEPRYCRSCVACDNCYKYMSDMDAIRVKKGDFKEHPTGNERICKICQGERVFTVAMDLLSRGKYVEEVQVRRLIAHDVVDILKDFLKW